MGNFFTNVTYLSLTQNYNWHYSDVILTTMASQITTSRLFTESSVQAQIKKKHQSSAPLAFLRGIHPWPVNSPHKGPVTRKMFAFDDVIMEGKECRVLKWKYSALSSNSYPISLKLQICPDAKFAVIFSGVVITNIFDDTSDNKDGVTTNLDFCDTLPPDAIRKLSTTLHLRY